MSILSQQAIAQELLVVPKTLATQELTWRITPNLHDAPSSDGGNVMYTLEWIILGLALFNTYCHLRWKLLFRRFDTDRYDELVSKLWSRKYDLMTPREQDEFDRLNKLRHSLRTSKFECQVGYVTDHLEITLRHELDVFRGEILEKVDSLTQEKKPSQRSNKS